MHHDKRPIYVLTEIESAQLIAKIAHGLLTGPCAVAFMRQTALQNGAELTVKPLMDVAEAMARESIKRGFNLSSFSCEMAVGEQKAREQGRDKLNEFFAQGRPSLGQEGGSDAEG